MDPPSRKDKLPRLFQEPGWSAVCLDGEAPEYPGQDTNAEEKAFVVRADPRLVERTAI